MAEKLSPVWHKANRGKGKNMEIFINYSVILVETIISSLILAVAFGFAIWILDKMLCHIKNLRHMMAKPVAGAIVIAGFILGVAIIISGIFQ